MGLGIGMHLGVPRAQRPGGVIEKNGLVLFNRFTPTEQTYPAQGSAEFDGASDYIDTGIDIDTTQSMTFGAWVYRADDSVPRAIVGDGYPTIDDEAGFALVTLSSSTNLLLAYGSTSKTISNILPALNEWYYLTTSFDSGIMKIYINGSVVYESTYANTFPQHSRSLFVGGRRYQVSPYYAIQFWEGNLANVAIWNRALTSDEINSVMWKDYNVLSATEKSSLQAWYSLDDIDGSSVPDSSGNGNDGTAN